MSPHVVEPTAGMNAKVNTQTLKEMTKFPPAPGVKNIMITGGNGFMWDPTPFLSLCRCHTRSFPVFCLSKASLF